jgi:hypothetical protein
MHRSSGGNYSIVDGPTRYPALRQTQKELPIGPGIEAKVWLVETLPEKISDHVARTSMRRRQPRQNGVGLKRAVFDQSGAVI